MSDHGNHDQIIKSAADQFKEILSGSANAIYIYLDDTHKLANQNFANLLEYTSVQEWENVSEPFAETFVEEESQHTLVHAYSETMENNTASQVQVVWKTKSGKGVNTNVIIAPIAVNGEVMAIHFIEKI